MQNRMWALLGMFLCFAAPLASAAGGQAGLGAWRYDVTGSIDNNGATLDFQQDLGLKSRANSYLQLEYNDAAGWRPEFALQLTGIRSSGSALQTSATQFGPIVVANGDRLITDGDFDDLALALRYPLQWRWLHAGIGLSVRHVSGEVRVTNANSGAQSTQSYDLWFPQIYGRLKVPLGRVVTLLAEGQTVRYSGDSASEWRIGAQVDFFKPLLVEYSRLVKRYDLHNGAEVLNARVSGNLLLFSVEIP